VTIDELLISRRAHINDHPRQLRILDFVVILQAGEVTPHPVRGG
jgi:hypothetical protein